MASTPVDIFIHDTYFIVAHIHYVVFGGSIFGIFAGIYYWFPKMFGRMMNETLGKIHFWLTLHLLQRAPSSRCTSSASAATCAASTTRCSTSSCSRCSTGTCSSPMGALLPRRGAAHLRRQLLLEPVRRPEGASSNPWHANTLEWEAPTPPPHGNFPGPLPTVYRGPYEYSRRWSRRTTCRRPAASTRPCGAAH